MALHPRENWDPRTGRRSLSRRDFLRKASALGLLLPGMPGFLAACSAGPTGTTTAGTGAPDTTIPGTTAAPGTTAPPTTLIPSPTPENRVTQPLFDDNPMIASGLPLEEGPLKLYNWEDYINPEIPTLFEEQFGVKVEISTFYNQEVAIQTMASGELAFDVWFPTAEVMSKVVAGKVIQPLNGDYITNLSNAWPFLADPYYDVGAQYSVPYVVYQTGIEWRNDMADSADIEGQAKPWDVFWNPKYKGLIGLYDDYAETLSMAMFRAGIDDPSKADEAQLMAAADSLAELVDLVNVRYNIDIAYDALPNGRYAVTHAWSGDVVNAQYYFPEEADVNEVLRYSWPANAPGSEQKGLIGSDTMVIPKNAEHPVLAHTFLNWLLDPEASLKNFEWLGYQPPQTSIDPETLVADGWVPEYLSSAIVRVEDFSNPQGFIPKQLDPAQELMWLDAWTKAKAGA